MSKTEARSKMVTISTELISTYNSILEKASRELPKIDRELVMNVLRYQTKWAKTPWVRLEITFKPSIDAMVKKHELFRKTGRYAEIRHRHVFVIDYYMTLQDLEELASDKDVEYIKGEIIP